MSDKNIPFQIINWDQIPKIEYPGNPGIAHWQTLQFEGLRIRIVELSAAYIADHWCQKGHIVHYIEGGFISEMAYGTLFDLVKGTSYVVTNEMSSHRSHSQNGVKLIIIDGDFLKYNTIQHSWKSNNLQFNKN